MEYNKKYFFDATDQTFCNRNILYNCESVASGKNVCGLRLDFIHTSKNFFGDETLKVEAGKQDYLKIKKFISCDFDKELCISFKNDNVIKYLNDFDTGGYINCYEKSKIVKNNTVINYKHYKLFVGFDTEYKSNLQYNARINEPEELEVEKNLILQNTDKIISYQLSFMIAEDLYINTIIFINLGSELDLYRVITKPIIDFLRITNDYIVGNDIFEATIAGHKNIVDFTKVKGMVSPKILQKKENSDKSKKDKNKLPKKYENLKGIRNCFVTMKPFPVGVYDKDRNYKTLGYLHYRDTLLLDNPQSLAYLGESLDFKKLEVGENIEHMDSFVSEDPNAFTMYATQDSNIVVKFLYSMYANYLGARNSVVPVTIAGYSASVGQKFLKDLYNLKNTEEFNKMFRGLECIKNGKSKSYFVREELERHFNTISDYYLGGRNETFAHGLYKGKFYDIDGAKFYPVMASILPLLDFRKNPTYLPAGLVTDQTLDFTTEEVGYAIINFDYNNVDPSILPCIPIKAKRGNDDKGLVFCREGKEVFATLTEIKSAVAQGAKVEILQGVKFEVVDYVSVEKFPFRELFKYFAEQRNKYPKKSQLNKLWKLIANSFTGKMGQGLKGKRCYDFSSNDMNTIPKSKVSSPAYITELTSLGRVVITEVMNIFILEGWAIMNVVTDGFLARSPEDKVFTTEDLNTTVRKYINDSRFPTLKRWVEAVTSLNEKHLLEIKHEGDILLVVKTRICALYNTTNEELSQFATTGFNNPPEWVDYSLNEQIKAFIDLVVNRNKRIKITTKKLISVKDVRKNHLVGEMIDKEISFNFDYKRKPKNITMENDYISITTEAWDNIEDFFKEKDYREKNKDIQITNLKGDMKMDLLEKLRTYKFRNVDKKNEMEDLTEKFFIALAKTKIFTIVGVGREIDYTILYRLLRLKGITLHTDETAFKKLKLQKFIKDNLEAMKYEMLELANRLFEEEKLRFCFAGAENNLIKYNEVFRSDEEIIKEREAIKEKEIKEIERLNLIQ